MMSCSNKLAARSLSVSAAAIAEELRCAVVLMVT
jgi:hypothetical protein